MSKKTIITKESWIKVFTAKNYEEFLKEWMDLHQAYFSTNPLPPKSLLRDLAEINIRGFLQLYLAYINDMFFNELLLKQIKVFCHDELMKLDFKKEN